MRRFFVFNEIFLSKVKKLIFTSCLSGFSYYSLPRKHLQFASFEYPRNRIGRVEV